MKRRNLSLWERIAAFAAAALAIALNVSASVQLFAPPTTFGYRLTYTEGYRVATVLPATAAARAGIAPGDHFDLTRSSLHDRIVALEYQPALPGERVTFTVVRDGRARVVTLSAAPLPAAESGKALFSPLASFLRLAGFIYIGVALIVLLRRPGRMTWGLFLYLVSVTDVTLYRFPEWLFLPTQFASDVLSVAGLVGLVIFAAGFPTGRPTGRRTFLDRYAIPVGALFAIPNLAWDATALFLGASPAAWMSLGATLGALALILVAGAALGATYLAAAPWERQRLQWAIAGVLMTFGSNASAWARYWSVTYALATSNVFVWATTLLYAIAPFAIAYAVVRQRVFGASFVVSRTVVYTILTASTFALFALIEWFAGSVLEHSGVAIVLVAIAAIVVAFSLDAIYSHVEHFVDGILFRRRHLAEHLLANVAAGLPNASNEATVEDALVREPVTALSLTLAKLYARDDDGEYVSAGDRLERSIPLRLQAKRHPVRLHDADADGDAEYDAAAPVLAVPIVGRLGLRAVAVYGAHANGEDVDPDEVASLARIGSAASIAYDNLDALRAGRQIERWRRIAERQARELAALRARRDKE